MKKLFVIAVLAMSFVMTGCQRIETGTVGLRVDISKQVLTQELQPGSFNQTMIGDVLIFPVRDISLKLNDMHPQTKDGSTLADMDITVIYAINPSTVGEVYNTKSRGMHLFEAGETYLMYNYLTTIANSASVKAVQKHNALDVMGARPDIEAEIIQFMTDALKTESLDTAITIKQVQVAHVAPAQSIIDSANLAISAKNDLVRKETQVLIARKDAEIQSLLSSPTNIKYMEAKSALNVSEGVRDGKVQTILIPHNLTMYGNSK
jgi:hypothetical protein